MKTKHLLADAKADGIEKLVVGAIVVSSHRVLLLTRAEGEFMGGLVELPSGGVEAGETLEVSIDA